MGMKKRKWVRKQPPRRKWVFTGWTPEDEPLRETFDLLKEFDPERCLEDSAEICRATTSKDKVHRRRVTVIIEVL